MSNVTKLGSNTIVSFVFLAVLFTDGHYIGIKWMKSHARQVRDEKDELEKERW